MAVASKVALVHDATLKAKELLEQYQAKHGTGNVLRGSISANKESFSQMASLLTPSFQNSNTQQQPGSMLNKGSLLGTSTFGAKPAGTGLFGNTATTTSNTGMFGNANTSTAGTGLFGNTTTTTLGTGMFGNTSNATATNGLFGSAKRSNSAGA
jgi:Nucleoporin FG repeat region